MRFSVPGHSLQSNTASTAAAISEQQDTIAAHWAWEKWINPAISFSELPIQQAAIDIAISLVQRHKIISDFISQVSVLQAEVLKGFLFRCISCLPLAHYFPNTSLFLKASSTWKSWIWKWRNQFSSFISIRYAPAFIYMITHVKTPLGCHSMTVTATSASEAVSLKFFLLLWPH